MERKIKRGDIYYADLNPVVGSEQGGTRPVLLWSSVFVTLVAKKYRFMQFELDMVFDTR